MNPSSRSRISVLSLALSLLFGVLATGCVTDETPSGNPSDDAVTPPANNADAAESFDMDRESVGKLRLGLSEKDVRAIVPGEPQKGEDEFWGAIGEYGQEWNYPAQGITLQMMSATSGGEKVVGSITITAPSTLKCRRGIEIGSSEADVRRVYGKFQATDSEGFSEPGSSFVAGSIYDGMIFTFSNGKVSEIFLGAAAE